MALRLPSKDRVHPLSPGSSRLAELPEGLSPFEILGVAENLHLDLEALREVFYSLSKLTHPDRYVTKDPSEAMLAARWSTAINRAYQTLRDPVARARAILARAGKTEPQGNQVPLELAETYFELQDALGEPNAGTRLAEFRQELEKRQKDLDQEWAELESAWSEGADNSALLERLAKHLTVQRFLGAMQNDLEKRGMR